MANAETDKLVMAAKNLEEKMQKAQQAIEALEITGGLDDVARVTINGHYDLLAVKLSEQLLKTQDTQLIEDAILAAHKTAMLELQEQSQKLLVQITAA